jgi:hypothetical protein
MKQLSILLITLAVVLAACSGATSIPAAAIPNTNLVSTQPAVASNSENDANLLSAEEIITPNKAVANTIASSAQAGILSEAEANALEYMREEEKLANDVYLALYNQWQLPIFQNIASSEQTHTEAIKTLLDRYGLQDPAYGEAGVFANQTLQDLYDQLVAQGSQSLAEALKVGAAIEEIDILDIEQRIALTNQPDITQVYANLLKGSGNHLSSFVSTLQNQTGEIYQPQYLSQDAYQAIVGNSIERGGPGGQGGQGGQSGQGGRGRGRGQS